MTNNYEKIKNMSIEEMAKVFQQKQCEECHYQEGNEVCQEVECWVNGDTYLNWLQQEAE